jgi:hypothetical protein
MIVQSKTSEFSMSPCSCPEQANQTEALSKSQCRIGSLLYLTSSHPNIPSPDSDFAGRRKGLRLWKAFLEDMAVVYEEKEVEQSEKHLSHGERPEIRILQEISQSQRFPRGNRLWSGLD